MSVVLLKFERNSVHRMKQKSFFQNILYTCFLWLYLVELVIYYSKLL